MKSKKLPAKERQDEVIALVEVLAQQMSAAKTLANAKTSRRCLVELESASMTIEMLIRLISSSHKRKPVNWSALVEAIAFIAKLIQKLYAFINCKIITVGFYEDWVNYKAVAYRRRGFANSACERSWNCSHLLITGGEQ